MSYGRTFHVVCRGFAPGDVGYYSVKRRLCQQQISKKSDFLQNTPACACFSKTKAETGMKPKCFSFAAADTKKIRLRSLLKEVIINLSKSCTKTRLLCRAGGQTCFYAEILPEKGATAMYKITEKVALNPTVTKMVIEAPLIAKKAKPGQFIIVRPFEDSERIPLTVAGYDREKGTVDIIFQIVGGTTMELNSLNAGDSVHDFVGPLGRATETEGLKKVCVVGGGVGCAIALPIAKELHDQGCTVHSVIGFRNKDLLILEDEFNACSDELRIMTDDGSYGTKGVVTAALDELVAAGNQYDLVITIGPLIMMKFVVKTCQKHGLKSIVSMNPIMIDGTGMCGGCRLTVGGETKFACVDGPDFDGDLVDFDEAMARGTMYRPFEAKAREKACNLFKTEEAK